MMKIAIDVTYTPSGGSLAQIINMIKYFNENHDIEIFIYSKKKNKKILEHVIGNSKVKLSFLANLSQISRVIWQQIFLPFHLKIDKIDILFSPGNISPFFSNVKTIQWIGTIGPFWEEMNNLNLGIYKYIANTVNKILMHRTAQRSDIVIFESEFTQNMFVNNFNIKDENTRVINIGKDEFFLRNNDDDKKPFTKTTPPFLLCVSHLYPYKNIIRMLEAFHVVLKNNNLDYNLLIAGAFSNQKYHKTIIKKINELSLVENVVLLGPVSKHDLKKLYLDCEILIFPSPCENFAYTLVEAMCCGAAIVCANTTAMPETCKDAALYFNPKDVREMSDKITTILKNKELGSRLRKKSLDRVKELPDYKQVTKETTEIIKNLFYQ